MPEPWHDVIPRQRGINNIITTAKETNKDAGSEKDEKEEASQSTFPNINALPSSFGFDKGA